MRACSAGCVLSVLLCSSIYAQQHLPAPQEQKRIDEAIASHIGDVPDDAGPMAKDLSPRLKPDAGERPDGKDGHALK